VINRHESELRRIGELFDSNEISAIPGSICICDQLVKDRESVKIIHVADVRSHERRADVPEVEAVLGRHLASEMRARTVSGGQARRRFEQRRSDRYDWASNIGTFATVPSAMAKSSFANCRSGPVGFTA
jgi:hypothetical protein